MKRIEQVPGFWSWILDDFSILGHGASFLFSYFSLQSYSFLVVVMVQGEELRLVSEDLKDYPGLPRLTYYAGVLRYELGMELPAEEQPKLANEAVKILQRRARDAGKSQEEKQQRSAAAYFCGRTFLDLLEAQSTEFAKTIFKFEATLFGQKSPVITLRLRQPMKAEKWFKRSIQLEKDFLYASVALIQMTLGQDFCEKIALTIVLMVFLFWR